MATNFLLRSYVSGKTYTERWTSWSDAISAKKKLIAAGHYVTIHWLDLDCISRDVTDTDVNPENHK